MNSKKEKSVDRWVTYTLAHEGKFYTVENVPARVDEETGEQFFFTGYCRTVTKHDSRPGKAEPGH